MFRKNRKLPNKNKFAANAHRNKTRRRKDRSKFRRPNSEFAICPNGNSENRNVRAKYEVSLPDFPFRLSNNVETKAKQTKITTEQFQTLIKLFAEILGTIDKTLATANLNFPAAFSKACSEISNDYPFLKPEENIFHYNKGEIKINASINPNQFSSSLLETVRRVMEKLGANPKFSETYRATVQNLLALMRQRKPLYDEFSITSKLEKIVGA